MGKRLDNLTIPGLAAPHGTHRVPERELVPMLGFHDFRRVRVNGNVGTLFWCHAIPERVHAMIRESNNLVTLLARSQYAPELRTTLLFVADRRMTN